MTLENRRYRYKIYVARGDTVNAEALKARYPDVEEVKEETKSKGKK